jgi:hypothetical protein
MATKCVRVCINRLILMPVGAFDFLSANDQNGVRLPVVKFLTSQRASSIQTLVTYFIVVRLVLINRISLQHCRPVDYVQEPNAEQASSRRKLLGETDMCSYCGLLIGSPRLEPLSSASRALWPGGSGFAAQGSGRALAPVHLVAPSLCPEESGPGLCFLPRKDGGRSLSILWLDPDRIWSVRLLDELANG